MEHLILKVLTFDVAVPTVNWFCDDFLKSCDDVDDKLKALTMVCTVKFLNFRTPENHCCLPKIQTKRRNLKVFRKKRCKWYSEQ